MQNKYLALALVSALAFSTNARAEGKNGVAAVVNGEEISVAEIKKGYEDNPQIKANVPFDDFYAKALDIYVNGKLVYQAAVADDITNTPEYKEQLKTAQEDVARKVFLEKKVKSVVTDAKIKNLWRFQPRNVFCFPLLYLCLPSSPKRKSRPVIFWSAPNLRQTTLLPS